MQGSCWYDEGEDVRPEYQLLNSHVLNSRLLKQCNQSTRDGLVFTCTTLLIAEGKTKGDVGENKL